MKPVILAEKPSQAKAYAVGIFLSSARRISRDTSKFRIFPTGAYITWGIGHLVELKEPKAYDPEWAKLVD